MTIPRRGKLLQAYRRVKEVGPKYSLQFALMKVGIGTHRTFSFPRSRLCYVVRFHPVWRQIEREEWEAGVLSFIQRQVKEGQSIIDVGAWIGPYAVLFSELVGPGGRVFAFEPDPEAREALYQNLVFNSISNVKVEDLCVGNSAGVSLLGGHHLGDSMTSILNHLDGRAAKETFKAQTTTLDAYCHAEKIFPDLIKIDVEGAEAMVIEGMAEIISNNHPRVVLEFHNELMDKQRRKENWQTITRHAKKVELLYPDVESDRQTSDLPLFEAMGDKNFNVFIQY